MAAMHPARASGVHFDLGDLAIDGDELRFSGEETVVEQFVIALGRHDVGVRALVPQQATLEQVFFELTESDGDAAPEPAPKLEAVS